MKFGWKPTVKVKVLPIPLIFDREDNFFCHDHINDYTKQIYPTVYQGYRPLDSLKMHKKLLGLGN